MITTKQIRIDEVRGEHGLLVMFICRHCPFVKHVEKEIAAIGRDFSGTGIGIAAISSNEADCYSEDSPPSLRQQAEQLGFTFPYLYDESQEVARAYDAACTPDFFLFDKDLKLVYRGQLDDSRPGNGVPADGRDLREAHEFADRGQADFCGAETEHWLQYQVESVLGKLLKLQIPSTSLHCVQGPVGMTIQS